MFTNFTPLIPSDLDLSHVVVGCRHGASEQFCICVSADFLAKIGTSAAAVQTLGGHFGVATTSPGILVGANQLQDKFAQEVTLHNQFQAHFDPEVAHDQL